MAQTLPPMQTMNKKLSVPALRVVNIIVSLAALVALLRRENAVADVPPSNAQERLVEWTIESRKTYADPFNDVDLDVIFEKDGQSWRVPTFWRGGQRWTVRFAPPLPGEYAYHLESTDAANPDLNAHEGHVTITAYTGTNPLLKHGMIRVSVNKRYFEHADGTPFYWLGDTQWMGLSERISWEGFQRLTADRQAKGFTVVQIVVGLVPDEDVPDGSGARNEGGPVWDKNFKHINPSYFDFADRRLACLINAGLVPALVGGWSKTLTQTGVEGMKKHWRYLIARYGAYPVLWVGGGEVYDPPEAYARTHRIAVLDEHRVPGWTEVVRYIKETDPHHHPLTVHEFAGEVTLQDESLKDFRLNQAYHDGWPSISVNVAELDAHYARVPVTQPIVQGEIGYENIGGVHLEDFQRTAFWLTMLNGAAGYTYGSAPTFEFNNPNLPLHNSQYSFMTWEEGMNLPGSYQVALSAKLLQQYPWWQFQPHPEWVAPRGTTLLEPRGDAQSLDLWDRDSDEWKAHGGEFRLPYAAGVQHQVRFVYIPTGVGMENSAADLTVLDLERGVRYHGYYWDPSLGIKFDLGDVERPAAGKLIREDSFEGARTSMWKDQMGVGQRTHGRLVTDHELLSVLGGIKERNGVAAAEARSDSDAGIVLRYQDADDYVAAVYSVEDRALYLLNRKQGVNSEALGKTPVPAIGSDIRLTAEVRDGWGAASLSDGQRTYTTPIVDITGSLTAFRPQDLSGVKAGSIGLLHRGGTAQSFGHFEVRRSPELAPNSRPLERKLYDARGVYRGEMTGPVWDDYARDKVLLLDAYRPERIPSSQDWVLVLEANR